MLETAVAALITALVGIVVREVSNKRVAALGKEVDKIRDENLALEKELYCAKKLLAQNGISPLALPPPDRSDV